MTFCEASISGPRGPNPRPQGLQEFDDEVYGEWEDEYSPLFGPQAQESSTAPSPRISRADSLSGQP